MSQEDIGLANAGQYLGEAFGSTMRIVWALGLCAAGQSSTMTGAYAGQWVARPRGWPPKNTETANLKMNILIPWQNGVKHRPNDPKTTHFLEVPC